jgi:DNA-directed RNA polymerase beta subunit
MKITFIVAVVIGLSLGSVGGWYNAEMLSGPMQSVEAIAASSLTSDFALQQFEHADNSRARQAVQLQIEVLERLEKADRDTGSEGQLGFAYTRLALIEEAAGQTVAERSAQDEARQWFKRSHPQGDLTDEQMRTGLKRMDAAFDRL